jgi:hypothetical protein
MAGSGGERATVDGYRRRVMNIMGPGPLIAAIKA